MGAGDIIEYPSWGFLAPWFQSVEQAVDNALSSNNWILNFFLSPVRTFVGAVLHWLFSLVDWAFSWASTLIRFVFDWLFRIVYEVKWAFINVLNDVWTLAYNAAQVVLNTARTLIDQAVQQLMGVTTFLLNLIHDVERRLTNAILGALFQAVAFAQNLFNNVGSLVAFLVGQALNVVYSVIDGVRSLVTFLVGQAVELSRQLVAGAIDLARFGIAQVEQLARSLVSGAISLTRSLIDVLIRDIILPIEHRLAAFIDTEWRWAFNLLKLVEDAGEWLLWVGTHIVPEAVDTWHALRAVFGADLRDLARWGAAAGAPRIA